MISRSPEGRSCRLERWPLFFPLAVFLAFLPSCGGDKTTGPADTTPPAAVTNLAASVATANSVTLTWTVPGDDGSSGTATQYDIRYARSTITAGNWAAAAAATGEPSPGAAGGTETFTVIGLDCDTTCYFALKTRDEVGDQWSGLSNVAPARTSDCSGGSSMVLVQAGSFTMGSPISEQGRTVDERQHGVTLTRAFYILDHEVTQVEWGTVMGWNDSDFPADVHHPVEQITWYDAVEFCRVMSIKDGLTAAYTITSKAMDGYHIVGGAVTWNQAANGYRLPTEAEWEYACRAGTTTAFCSGGVTNVECSEPNLGLVGWYCGNAGGTTHPVGQKQANPWGLKDLHGNVAEWCWDFHDIYPFDPTSDPKGPDAGLQRVVRGGAWNGGAAACRSGARSGIEPNHRYDLVGMRLVRTAP